MQLQHITRHNLAPEFAAVDAHEIDEEFFVGQVSRNANHHRSRLGHRLNNCDAGHDWHTGKVALKMRLIYGDVLQANRGFERHDIAHPVHQQERVTMWQYPLDKVDIGDGLGVCRHGAGLRGE